MKTRWSAEEVQEVEYINGHNLVVGGRAGIRLES
jgi:hypothetical protein